MQLFRMLLASGAIYVLNLGSNPAGLSMITPDLTKLAGRAVNRTGTVLVEDGVRGLRLKESPGQGLVWIPNVRFATGTIQVDLRGKDVFQRSFIGVAFHGIDDSRYEVLYVRPFNFRTEDPVRRSHAIQYAHHPDLPWARLRSERPGEFESGLGDALDPNGWVRLRLEIFTDRLQAFVGDTKTATLDVARLSTVREGMIGLWVGDGSGGDFANLQIELKPPSSLVKFPVTPGIFIDPHYQKHQLNNLANKTSTRKPLANMVAFAGCTDFQTGGKQKKSGSHATKRYLAFNAWSRRRF